MTKVDAIECVLRDNGGSASLPVIYNNIEKYYPTAKNSACWEAGIRGVLYRELNNGSRFKKVGLSIYALSDYQAEHIIKKDKCRMHSLMEGICLEIGNTNKYQTYTADPSMLYRDNTYLRDISTIKEIPPFTYQEIIHSAKLIDVLWFSTHCLAFPLYAFEIVDSISTLNAAINRCLQLQNFRTKFWIVAPEIHHQKFEQTMAMSVYEPFKKMFSFIDYDTMQDQYQRLVCGNILANQWTL